MYHREDDSAVNKPIPTKKATCTFSMEAKKCMPRKGKAFGKPSGTLHAGLWRQKTTYTSLPKTVVVLGRLDTLGVVVHDLRIRHSRRSSANLGHAVEGHVLLAV